MASTFLSTIHQSTRELNKWVQKQEGSSSSAPGSTPPPSLKDDLDALQRLLSGIEAVLHDAEEREILDDSVRLWLRDLRKVAYDADDVLDEYEYQRLRDEAQARIQDQLFPDAPDQKRKSAEQVSGSITTPPPSVDALYWDTIASKVKKIRVDFEKISKLRERLRLRTEDGRRRHGNSGHPPPTSSVIDVFQAQMLGRERELDKLINGFLLSDQSSRSYLSVIPVVGMGGVGKTTLVQHVYNHPRICEGFGLRGWVCVSTDSDLTVLTKRIFESFTSTACDLTELDPIQRKLIEVLKGKRFLLVLDDVWNEKGELWDKLRAPLVYGEKGSAVISTTRSAIAARIMQTSGESICRLECLSYDSCWTIFQYYAFHGLNSSDSRELVEIGEKIVERCRGLPLAARALGSMLRYKTEVESWENVLQSEIWDLQGEILPALMLSYVHLPPHLKRCFVYCSLFSKDHRFQKDELVLLWVAQGFIQCRRRRQVEDIAATYVDELIHRSLFHYRDSVDTSTFVMHDLIHDLAQYNSRAEYCRIDGEVSFDTSHTRHLSIATRSHDIAALLASLPSSTAGGLRTLHLFDVKEIRGLSNMLMSNLKGLRTLAMSDQHIGELPDSVGELKHLRHLDLSGTDIAKLPETLCNLHHLHTLLLRRCKHLDTLPEVVLKLANLQCLEYSRYL